MNITLCLRFHIDLRSLLCSKHPVSGFLTSGRRAERSQPDSVRSFTPDAAATLSSHRRLLTVANQHVHDRELAVDCRVERDDGLAARQPQRLELIVNDVEQMMVVDGVYFDEHVKITGGIMTFNHLRNVSQFFHNSVKFLRIFQIQSYIGTCLIAYFLQVDNILRPLENAEVRQFLYSLMNSSAADIACTGYLQNGIRASSAISRRICLSSLSNLWYTISYFSFMVQRYNKNLICTKRM